MCVYVDSRVYARRENVSPFNRNKSEITSSAECSCEIGWLVDLQSVCRIVCLSWAKPGEKLAG